MKKDKKGKVQEVSWYDRRLFVFLLLVGLPALVYIRSIGFEFTMLDDSIFIKENQAYNSELSNITESFKRGLFNPTGDFYYRPIFLVDFILESRLFGTTPAGYHFTNLLFHILCVVLLYLLLKKLKIPPGTALILALIFAVHPVLSQAVAWIPGRNDMLLMIFFLAGLLLSMKFAETPRWYLLAGQFMALLLALFTKETAVIIPVIVLAVLVVNKITRNGNRETNDPSDVVVETGLKPVSTVSSPNTVLSSKSTSSSKTIPATKTAGIETGYKPVSTFVWVLLLLSWVFALAIWFFVRSKATLKPRDFTMGDLVMNGIDRLPAVLQYLGKVFLPFNLTVFPSIDHITIWWGVTALALVVFLVIWSGSYSRPLTWIGFGWYLLFLVPVLVVPASLNDQVFEHRLYLPFVGILVIIGQVIVGLSSKFKVQMSKFKIINFWGRAGMGAMIFILLFFSVLTYARISYFKDPVSFWTKAVEGNPSSAYAHMMLGLRMEDPALMRKQFETAYTLNPEEKMLNYLIGKLALDDNDLPKAEMHLKKELSKSEIPDNYFNLARVFFLKNNPDSAAWCLENVIRLDPAHPQANHNLLLLYIQQGRKEKASMQSTRMQSLGLEIPQEATPPTKR